jgi:acetyltransferase-like isoleucine patch superfamily enzyme
MNAFSRGWTTLGGLADRLLRFTPPLAGLRVEVDGELEVRGRVWIPGPGVIRIGRGVRLVGRRAPIELRAHAGGEIVIEDGVLIEDGTSIEATRLVHIGPRARIGPFCKIIDNHFHRVAGDRRERPEGLAVAIGEGAVIGPRAVVLPGGALGAGARLGPAQVLSFRLLAGMEHPRPHLAGRCSRDDRRSDADEPV